MIAGFACFINHSPSFRGAASQGFYVFFFPPPLFGIGAQLLGLQQQGAAESPKKQVFERALEVLDWVSPN